LVHPVPDERQQRIAAVLAMLVANSPLANVSNEFLQLPVIGQPSH
jgi:Na+/H+ antiporter NhaA